jgi:hypothetical protein
VNLSNDMKLTVTKEFNFAMNVIGLNVVRLFCSLPPPSQPTSEFQVERDANIGSLKVLFLSVQTSNLTEVSVKGRMLFYSIL